MNMAKFKLIKTDNPDDPKAQCPHCLLIFNIIDAWGCGYESFCPKCGVECTEELTDD